MDQCFTPETQVQTSKGFKAISEIAAGDVVMTSGGEYKEVIKNKKYAEREREMIEIETNDGTVSVTPQHLFLAIRNGNSIENVKEKIEKGVVQPEWIEAGRLKNEDLIVSI